MFWVYTYLWCILNLYFVLNLGYITCEYMDFGYIISEYVTFIYILGVYIFFGYVSSIIYRYVSNEYTYINKGSVIFWYIPCKSTLALCTSPKNISVLEKVYGYDILGICTNEKIGRRHQHVLYKPKTQKNN